jgi:hypothetical protein
MTRDDIIRMAIKCQLANAGNREGLYMDALAEFAELVAEVEREECAKFIEDKYVRQFDEPWRVNLAKAIRARGQQ